MSKPHYKTLDEVPARIRQAYTEGDYSFRAPPVPTFGWRAVDWINYVNFNPEYHDGHTQREPD